jgi:hypothetical protein
MGLKRKLKKHHIIVGGIEIIDKYMHKERGFVSYSDEGMYLHCRYEMSKEDIDKMEEIGWIKHNISRGDSKCWGEDGNYGWRIY